jgi:hypothetical protein
MSSLAKDDLTTPVALGMPDRFHVEACSFEQLPVHVGMSTVRAPSGMDGPLERVLIEDACGVVLVFFVDEIRHRLPLSG